MIQYPKKFIRCKCGEEYWLEPELAGKDHVMYISITCPKCGRLVSDKPEPAWMANSEHIEHI